MWIVERARLLGFDLCGIVRAEKFPELSRTEEWLARGYAGEMKYLSDPRRADPTRAMEGVSSVIVCALNYNTGAPRSTETFQSVGSVGTENVAADERGWISRYAWGDDYHEVLQGKLRALSSALGERFAEPFEARMYSDTGPVNERVLAKHAGLGWIGKNTLLLNAKLGSWFFLGVILTTLDLEPTVGGADGPPRDLCGSCTKCIEACPTDALIEPYVMDSRRCIAYLTIEYRGNIPEELREAMGRHVFGCDICQDVCPWNRRAPATDAAEFQPRSFLVAGSASRESSTGEADITPRSFAAPAHGRLAQDDQQESGTTAAARRREAIAITEEALGIAEEGSQIAGAEKREDRESLFLPRLEWLASLTEEQFHAHFRGSPIKRTKWRGLLRNTCIALGNAAARKSEGRVEDGAAVDSQAGARKERARKVLRRLAESEDSVVAESAHWAISRIE